MKKRKIIALLLATGMLLCLCGCGAYRTSGNSSSSQSNGAVPASMYYAEAAEEADFAVYDVAEYEVGFSPVNATAASASDTESGEETQNPDKIIYSADVTLETTEFDETVGKVSELISSVGGWIESSSVSGANYYQISKGTAKARDASFTLRIPSGRFYELMDRLSTLGNVPYSHIYTENVTSQYYDTQARLKAYTTQETRLLEMMELAESVEDVIIIEDRLTELRYQIEALQSNLNNWDRRVSYSTLRLSVREVEEYTPEEKTEPTYGEELAAALKNGLHNAGQFLKDLLVFLIEIIPVLIILIPVIWLLVWLIRKLVRRGADRRAARKEAKLSGKARKAQEKADRAKGKAAELSGQKPAGDQPDTEGKTGI